MADLTTLANVKAWLKITDTSLDTLLTRLITATSADFLNEIRRPDLLPEVEYTERLFRREDFPRPAQHDYDFYHRAHQAMFLRHYPVNSITSVTVNGDAVNAATDPATDTGYWIDLTRSPEDRQKVFLLSDGGLWYPGFNEPWVFMPDIVIIYKGGYTTVPPAIEQAVIEWVSFRRGQSQLQQLDQSAGGERIGDYELVGQVIDNTMTAVEAEIPVNVQRVIDQYRRPVI